MEPVRAEQDVQIPVLKKEEKERKGAGIPLPGAAAASKTLPAGGFMGLLAGKMGLCLLACGLGGAGLIGYGMMQQGTVRLAGSGPQLAAPEMAVRVAVRDSQGSRSLSYLAQSGQGQLKWDDPNAVRPTAKAEDAKPDEPKPADAVSDAAKPAEGLPKAPDQFSDHQKLGGLSGAKLSSQLGGGFGKHNIFQGNGFAPKPSQLDGKLKDLKDFRQKTSSGKLSGLSRGKQTLLAKRIGTQGIGANKVMGQLKYSGSRSQEAARAGGTEAGSTYAADAFNGERSDQGSAPTSPGVTGGEVSPMGGSAPDVTSGEGSVPSVGPGENATPYQSQVNAADQLNQTALTLLYVGFALIVLGAILLLTPLSAWVGGIILGIGIALCAVAMMLQAQARQMGDQIGNGYGQKDQQKIIDRTSTNSGNRTYDKYDSDFQQKSSTVHQDVEKESNAGYHVQ